MEIVIGARFARAPDIGESTRPIVEGGDIAWNPA